MKRHALPRLAALAAVFVPLAGFPLHAQNQLATQSFRSLAPAPADFATDFASDEEVPGDTVGTMIAGLPFRTTFAVREGFDDNLFTTKTDKESSFYTNFAAGVRYDFGGPRLKLTADLGGGVTYYYTRPGDKVDFNGLLSLSATYLATPKLTLTFTTVTAYLSQPDTNIIGGTNRVDGDYLYTNTTLAAAYQWAEKFSTVTSYNLYANYYLENQLNDELSYFSQTISQSFRYLLLPKTTLVAEYRANPVTYVAADLNSFGNFALLGFDQVFNPRLRWTLRAGVEQRFLNNPVDGKSDYIGPYGESALSYQYGRNSSIAWTARYGTEASGLTNVTQRQTFRTGLAITQGITSRLSANVGLNFEVDYFDQAGVIESYTQTVWDLAVGATFRVNRTISLNAGYQFIAVNAPDAPQVEYTRNVAFVGANFSF